MWHQDNVGGWNYQGLGDQVTMETDKSSLHRGIYIDLKVSLGFSKGHNAGTHPSTPSPGMALPSLQHYVDRLMFEGQCADCALVNVSTRRVMAATPGGSLEHLTRREIRRILARKREAIQTQGVSLGGLRCALLRDNMVTPGERSMDLRTKHRPSRGVAVRRTRHLLLVLLGNRGISSGFLNHKAYQMAACLRKAGSSQLA
ncbi:profilin-2-like [Oncorhynchus tshawytscha]|nr:profilin-2-like [Oncorhynchus tshawytscha]